MNTIGGCKLESSGSIHQLSNRSPICSPRTPLHEVINILPNICICTDSSEYNQTRLFFPPNITRDQYYEKYHAYCGAGGWRSWAQFNSVFHHLISLHMGKASKSNPPPSPSTWFPPPFLCFKNMKQTWTPFVHIGFKPLYKMSRHKHYHTTVQSYFT